MAVQSSPAEDIDAEDWATIWRSEMAALAVDREWQEQFFTWGQAWVAAGDDVSGRASPDAPEGAAPAGLAPDAEQRAAEFQRSLAELARRVQP